MLKLVLVAIFSLYSLSYAQNITQIVENNKRIVVLKPNVTPNEMASEVAKKYGAQKGHVYNHAIKGFSIELPEKAVQQLKKDNRIQYIVKDKIKKTNSIPSGIQRSFAHKNATANIANDGGAVDIDVAVIDTGIDLDHPRLNVFRSANFAKGKNADDGNGHGTHVAGTIAGLDDGQGNVGMAPGARLWAIRVLDNRGSGWMSDVIAGIDYATLHADEIEVVNMSLGGSGSDDGNCGLTNNDPEHTAICNLVNKGVVVVVAAGNENQNAANSTPAAYDEVITVSAYGDTDGLAGGNGPQTSRRTNDDTFADFTNFGADVDIAAPGVDIYSTYKDGTYATLSGTSMASPHVAGAAALYISKFGRAYNKADTISIKNALVASADAQNSVNGISGDKDAFNEPVLNVENFDPLMGRDPVLNMHLSSNQSSYNSYLGQNSAIITIQLTNEYSEAVETGVSFISLLNNQNISLNFTQTQAGIYQAQLDLASYSDGQFLLYVQATDSARSLSNSKIISFTKTSIEPPAVEKIFVSSITYDLSGGKSQDRNLNISIEIQDTSHNLIESSQVSISLYRNNSLVGNASALTGANGIVTFQLRNASSGEYSVIINNVQKSGYEYDASLNQSDPGFTK